MYFYVRYSILVYNYVFGLVYVIFKELIYLCSILMILSYLLIIIKYLFGYSSVYSCRFWMDRWWGYMLYYNIVGCF